MAADGDLDQTVRRVDPERWLASRFIGDAQARADVIAILAYDHELDRADRVTSNALLAEIRLTWWREVLDEIFTGAAVRRHPTAQALAEAVRRRRHPRPLLEAMIEARIDRIADPVAWSEGTAGSVALLMARTLDPDVDAAAAKAAGRAWGLWLLRSQGRGDIDLASAVADASRRVGSISVAAFPAVAYASLVRARNPSPLETRVRLLWSVLRGRL